MVTYLGGDHVYLSYTFKTNVRFLNKPDEVMIHGSLPFKLFDPWFFYLSLFAVEHYCTPSIAQLTLFFKKAKE